MKRARDEKTKSVNFFLNDTNEERVFGNEKPDPNRHYLILQNEVLHAKIMALEQEHNTMNRDLEDKEKELDTFDEQARYMKGEFKNFVELRRMADEITCHVENKEEINQFEIKNLQSIKHRLLMFIFISELFRVITFFVLYHVKMYSIQMVLICEVIHIMNSSIATLTTPLDLKIMADLRKSYVEEKNQLETEIKKLKHEIKKTDDSNDFISKYIECL